MTRRQCLSLLRGLAVAGLATGGLAACGRKNRPEPPPGADYPQFYPYVPPAERKNLPTEAEQKKQPNPDDSDQLLRLDPNTKYPY